MSYSSSPSGIAVKTVRSMLGCWSQVIVRHRSTIEPVTKERYARGEKKLGYAAKKLV